MFSIVDAVGRARFCLFVRREELFFRNRRWPQLMEPVVIRLHELDRHVRVEVVRRDDVEHREVRDLVRMIEREPLADAAAAIVADDGKSREAVVVHHLDHVDCHRALGVVGMIRRVGRLAAVAISAQVRHHDRVILREIWRDLVPRHMGLRRAVNQQQRRTVAAAHDVDLGPGRLHAFVFETGGEEVQRVGLLLRGRSWRSG
jgi:hypothetical protein